MISPLPRFIALYAGIYAAYGVASPFLPAFLRAQGVAPGELGVVLGAATVVKLAIAPVAGRAGDALHSLRFVLAGCIAAGAALTLGYLGAGVFWVFLALALLQAAALAPMPVLADALALENARPRAPHGFEYGWVRGTGSAAFIAGTLAAGQAIAAAGLQSIIWMQAALLGAAALAALRVPEQRITAKGTAPGADLRSILRIPAFRAVVVAAALVLGSHAMHDAFAAIRWSEAGVGPRLSSLLWSLAVAAEVIVFFVIGPPLVDRLTPAGAIALAAAGGVLRWAVMAGATAPAVYAAIQPLHGLTFALLHLACMRIIARVVPPGVEGTAQAIYVVGAGGLSALLTLGSGVLYSHAGPGAFWAMAALCILALPLAWRLARLPAGR